MSRGPVVTIGEAIVAVVPDAPVPIAEAGCLRPHVGGAELNFAVGLARLGQDVAWIGALGNDPFGGVVRSTLTAEGIDDRFVAIVDGGRTALYLREWLPDGQRRLVYYRQGSVASELTPALWPDVAPAWVHVTGITPALGDGPASLVEHAVSWAHERGIPVSLDPNFRPALWSAAAARDRLLPLAERSSVVLLSDEDAEMMFGSRVPDRVLECVLELGARVAVLKRGDRGVIARKRDRGPLSTLAAAGTALDPVGAGDGFDAGFVVAMLATGDLEFALELGAYVGARAVEAVGEHCYPSRSELPEGLRRRLARDVRATFRS
jgi:2-dehydro-3-deoxygluconokinase